MSKISKDQVKHVADLANIPLVEGEDKVFSKMFSDTLDYINILKELNTKGIEETYQVTGLINVYQKGDENDVTLSQSEALQNAVEKDRGLIVTKGVFSER